MNTSILVLGATGNLGGEVVRQLVAKGYNVRTGVRQPEKYNAPSAQAEAIRFDCDDPTSYTPALDGIEQLFLIARPLDPEAPLVLAPVIQAAKQAGVQRIVFNSALGVDQNEAAPLRQVERQLEVSGIAHTLLRPNFFMENFSNGFIAPMIHKSDGIFVAADDTKTSFISVVDIAAVAVAALTEGGHEGKAYNLTGSESLDHSEVAATLSEVTGRDIIYQAISEEEMCQGAIDNGLPEPMAGYLAVLYQATRAGYMAVTTPDVAQVLSHPPVSFVDYASQNAAAWKA